VKIKALPDLGYLRECFEYDRRAGRLWWKKRPLAHFVDRSSYHKWNARYAGKEAFTANSHGYRVGAVDGGMYPAHRIIWKLEHGDDPAGQLDHKSRNKAFNGVKNLRPTTHSLNCFNQGKHSKLPGGRKGVRWRPDKGRWYAHIGVGNKQLFLGSFTSFRAARAARQAAELLHFGEYAA